MKLKIGGLLLGISFFALPVAVFAAPAVKSSMTTTWNSSSTYVSVWSTVLNARQAHDSPTTDFNSMSGYNISGSTNICQSSADAGYFFWGANSAVYSDSSLASLQADADFYVQYICVGTVGVDLHAVDLSEGGTNIGYVQPLASSTVATSTSFTFEVAGFISATDWTPDTVVTLNASSNSYNQISSVYSSVNSQYAFSWSPSGPGDFIFSTTTDVETVGEYQLSAAISQPTYSLFGVALPFFTTGLAATSTEFLVSTSTELDSLYNSLQISYTTLAESASTTLSSCGVLTFNLTTCLGSLFLPSVSEAVPVFNSLRDGIMSVAPFGYVTRTITILTGTATSTLPSLTLTLPAGYPGAGASLDLTPWNELLGGNSILATATSSLSDGKTLRQITEPYWDIFVLVLFALAVLHDVLGFNFNNASGHTERSKMKV